MKLRIIETINQRIKSDKVMEYSGIQESEFRPDRVAAKIFQPNGYSLLPGLSAISLVSLQSPKKTKGRVYRAFVISYTDEGKANVSEAIINRLVNHIPGIFSCENLMFLSEEAKAAYEAELQALKEKQEKERKEKKKEEKKTLFTWGSHLQYGFDGWTSPQRLSYAEFCRNEEDRVRAERLEAQRLQIEAERRLRQMRDEATNRAHEQAMRNPFREINYFGTADALWTDFLRGQ